ncbi:MAG: tryptophan--tRNA ligase [Bacilli bacterium]|nr:tryptophan--tRNA ligase [Bacilli bacterium]
MKKRIFSGVKPSGDLTLGNYIGAISNFVKLQNDYDCLFCVVDLHAITVPQDRVELNKRIKDIAALYIACGIDPNKAHIFIQSEVPGHTQLAWILECHTYIGELNRMTQFKDKAQKLGTEGLSSGLYTYPVLMAADILLYDADLVPVGEDQKQHVEITRDVAIRFNNRYGETFVVPEHFIPKVGARIMDLQEPTKKMSKSESDKGCILLLDEPQVIRKKIMSAVTDSETEIYYNPEKKPGISNLISIYAIITNKTIDEVVEEFKGSNYGTFKRAIADKLIEKIQPIQERFKEIRNSHELDVILDRGREYANNLANRKIEQVMQKVGLGRF